MCVARKLDLIDKHRKIQLGISFMKTCRREDLLPSSVIMNIWIKHSTQNLKATIACVAMEIKIQNKHD